MRKGHVIDHYGDGLSLAGLAMVKIGWSLTSFFSINTAILETKGQGWRVILLSSEGRLAIYQPQPWLPFCSAATQKGKGIERLIYGRPM